jgi:hypothetical protein
MQRPSTQLRLVPILIAVAFLAVVFGFVQGESVDATGPSAAVAVAWWVSPLAAYFYAVRSRVGAIVIGALYVAAVIVGAMALYASTGSTSAVGFLTIPVVLWSGMIVALVCENLALRLPTNA